MLVQGHQGVQQSTEECATLRREWTHRLIGPARPEDPYSTKVRGEYPGAA